MKVSVIVPLYNKAPYVCRTLESVAAQTYTDFEVVVVDDGSNDGGADVVAGLGHSWVRVIRQENAGPGAARNRGLMEARGEYVAFLDADDEWLPGFLERGVALLDSSPGVATFTSGYFDHPPGRSTEPLWRGRRLRSRSYLLTPETDPVFAVHLLAYMSPCTTLARAEVLARYGGFYHENRCRYGEDSFLFLAVALNNTVAVDLEPIARFHRDASALSRKGEGPRPVEPLLSDPDKIRDVCPVRLRGLLEKILAVRAIKTACMLGYWGRWREARDLLRTFCPSPAWSQPWYWAARVCASPLAPPLGHSFRRASALLGSRPPSPGGLWSAR